MWDEAGGLWFIVLTREHKKVQKISLPRQHFLPSYFNTLGDVVTAWQTGSYPGGTPYNGLCGEIPPERGTFFRLQVYERVGISLDEVYERVEQ